MICDWLINSSTYGILPHQNLEYIAEDCHTPSLHRDTQIPSHKGTHPFHKILREGKKNKF